MLHNFDRASFLYGGWCAGRNQPLEVGYLLYSAKDPSILHQLYEHLNSEEVGRWLIAHTQMAANDFIRLQSSVLKKLPVPLKLLNQSKSLSYTASNLT